MIQSSLAEGAAFSTLEALACGTPVVATNIGGMAAQLAGVARLTPRRDAEAMAEEILWVATHRREAVAQAMRGREYVLAEWRRDKVFDDLKGVLERAAAEGKPRAEPGAGPPQASGVERVLGPGK